MGEEGPQGLLERTEAGEARRTILAPLVHEPDFGGLISLGARCKRRRALAAAYGRSIMILVATARGGYSFCSEQPSALQRRGRKGVSICWFPHAKPADPRC